MTSKVRVAVEAPDVAVINRECVPLSDYVSE
jgi:hypothetical protein